jgi:hypothetical protein
MRGQDSSGEALPSPAVAEKALSDARRRARIGEPKGPRTAITGMAYTPPK